MSLEKIHHRAIVLGRRSLEKGRSSGYSCLFAGLRGVVRAATALWSVLEHVHWLELTKCLP